MNAVEIQYSPQWLHRNQQPVSYLQRLCLQDSEILNVPAQIIASFGMSSRRLIDGIHRQLGPLDFQHPSGNASFSVSKKKPPACKAKQDATFGVRAC